MDRYSGILKTWTITDEYSANRTFECRQFGNTRPVSVSFPQKNQCKNKIAVQRELTKIYRDSVAFIENSQTSDLLQTALQSMLPAEK